LFIINLVYTKGGGYGQVATASSLGYTNTDDTGGFSFTYPQQDIAGLPFPRIQIVSLPLRFDSIPPNQDVNKRFYASTLGTLNIYLETDTPLNAGDTLFLGYPVVHDSHISPHIDTITSPINGFYKTLRTPPPYTDIFWGRGNKQFQLSKDKQGFMYVAHELLEIKIGGDPIINEVTLKY
jgi:hypothetical protein